MTATWVEFPEINRKVAFNLKYTSVPSALGCHTGTLAGISASIGSGYYAANLGKNLAVLDTEKEPELKYTKRDGYFYTSSEELAKIVKYLKDTSFVLNDSVNMSTIVSCCKPTPLWIMSDVINSEAAVRKVPTSTNYVYETFGRTSDFVKYLINNKIGYVLESPLIQNPNHRLKNNYSLNQAWFWVHPNHLDRVLNIAQAHGEDQLPNKAKWASKIGEDLGINKEEDVIKAVFNGGVFPEERRFKRASILEA